jgi:hypothetical protein
MNSSTSNPATGTGEPPASINTSAPENVEGASSSTTHHILTQIRISFLRIYTSVALLIIQAAEVFVWCLRYIRDKIMWIKRHLPEILSIVAALEISQLWQAESAANLALVLSFGIVFTMIALKVDSYIIGLISAMILLAVIIIMNPGQILLIIGALDISQLSAILPQLSAILPVESLAIIFFFGTAIAMIRWKVEFYTACLISVINFLGLMVIITYFSLPVYLKHLENLASMGGGSENTRGRI